MEVGFTFQEISCAVGATAPIYRSGAGVGGGVPGPLVYVVPWYILLPLCLHTVWVSDPFKFDTLRVIADSQRALGFWMVLRLVSCIYGECWVMGVPVISMCQHPAPSIQHPSNLQPSHSSQSSQSANPASQPVHSSNRYNSTAQHRPASSVYLLRLIRR